MKKILIANNNMKIGGVQKSLYNLLWTIHGKYDITLFLFAETGEYISKLPPDITILTASSEMRYLGISQRECSGISEKLARGIYAAGSGIFGRSKTVEQLLKKETQLPEEYDVAISFLHNGSRKMFYGGVNEFVLQKTIAKKKIAFLHCDYKKAGCDAEENNRLYDAFDTIAACSNGCRESFLQVLPALAKKTVTVRNVHRIEEIISLAAESPKKYIKEACHIVTVSRLSKNKGIERAVRAVENCIKKGFAVQYHIVGDGADRNYFRQLVKESDLESSIFFYGNTDNPYRYMIHADLLLIPSFHEAAPMVIDEARVLHLPVLSTETTSVKEMIVDTGAGWICKNSQADLAKTMEKLLLHREILCRKKEEMKQQAVDNTLAYAQWKQLLGENSGKESRNGNN